MELMNNLKRTVADISQRRRVKKNRLTTLKINYHEGLVKEYQKKLADYKPKEEALINMYHEELVTPLQTKLNGTNKHDEKKKKLLARFEEKIYWQRRRLKVKSKDLEENDLQKTLEAFDRKKEEEKQLYLLQLEQKFPNHELDQASKNQIEQKIEQLESQKEKDLLKMEQKYNRLKQRTELLLKRNEEKIKAFKLKKENLYKLIKAYNKQKQQNDQVILEQLEKQRTSLKQDDQKVTKKLENTEQKIEKLKTIENVLENDDIHLSIKNLKMYFGGVKAVNDLSFDVKKGEIFGLIGPNGAGKTTVFNCITQFYKATAGHMIIRNKENHVVDLYDLKTHDMIKEGIARSFQNVELIWELTVIDNLMVSAHSLLITNFYDHIVHTRKLYREDLVMRTKAMQILKDLGIESYAYRSPYGLPYGILKKIELARTLMTNPSMIILDEPAAGLNDAETEDLAHVIKHINQTYDATIFLVEHDMSLVMSICDTICAISFGKRIGLGTPTEIQNNPEVRKAYLGDDQNE